MTIKRFGGEWLDFQQKVIPRGAPEIQIQESRRAYYAGATTLLSLIMQGLDPGLEPTDSDLRRMDLLKAELDQFWKDVEDGKA